MESTWVESLVKVGDKIQYEFEVEAEDEDSQHRRPLEYQASAQIHFRTNLAKHWEVYDWGVSLT